MSIRDDIAAMKQRILDETNGQVQGSMPPMIVVSPRRYEWMRTIAAQRGLTVDELAYEWFGAGLPPIEAYDGHTL